MTDTNIAIDVKVATTFGEEDKVEARLGEGHKVEANYRGRGKWYPGKIVRDRGDSTFDINYDDGEAETGVSKDMIRVVVKVSIYRLDNSTGEKK